MSTAQSSAAKAPKHQTPPPDAMIEISVGTIDEGAFVKEFDHGLREAHGALHRFHEATGDKSGKVEITGKITIQYDKDANEYVAITHVVSTKTPVRKSKSFVREKAGKLLTPINASSGAPDQLMMFDTNGRVLGMYDPSSQSVVPGAGDIAGVINPA